MKRILIATILGIATVTSYGQGMVALDTYTPNGYNVAGNSVLYGIGSGGTIGDPVAGGFTMGLAYFIGGGIVDGASNGNLLGQFVIAPDTAPNIGSLIPGVVIGPTVAVGTAAYVNANVSFELIAYNGTDYASSLVRGHSAAFDIGALATGTAFPTILNGMSGFSVSIVPEPSTFALLGLGAAAMMIFRRRQ